MSELMARIARIQQAVGDVTYAGELFRQPEFREVHARPEPWIEPALQLLESAEASEVQKIIVALAMQKLPLPDLVAYDERVLDALEAGRLGETVFERAVFPTFDWNTTLQEQFDDPRVQHLLGRVLGSEKVGARRKEIVRDAILTGKAKDDVLRLREAGQIK